jgi:hypothetical protein
MTGSDATSEGGYSDRLAEQNFITFNDPTGEAAVAHLMGDVTIRWRNGFIVRIPESKSRGLIRWLNTFDYTRSSRGLITAETKKGPAPTGPSVQPNRQEEEGQEL